MYVLIYICLVARLAFVILLRIWHYGLLIPHQYHSQWKINFRSLPQSVYAIFLLLLCLSSMLCSSISSILTTIIGVHYGHVLVHMKTHLNRLKLWIPMGLALLIFGIILHFTHVIPLNKQLYSFSYICVTAGAAAIVFSIFYFLVDILGLRTLFLPLEWIGMNAMLVFVMAAEGIFEGFLNGWYYESPNNTLVYWTQKHIFIKVWHSQRVGILLYVIFAQILFWALVAGILHQLGIYWKL